MTATDTYAIDQDVTYTIDLARYYPDRLRRYGVKIEGAAILELGPGRNFGLALILASQGANVTVADRFLSKWDHRYHSAFYKALRERWEGPGDALDATIRSAGHALIPAISSGAERLASLQAKSVDAVISHAVLEHVSDLPAVCRELARITRPGGVHIHQIDFRDHRDFSRPLEFLTMPDGEFAAGLHDTYWEQGNRWRPSEVLQLVQDHGFDILAIGVDTMISDRYLAEFLPRLWASPSKYHDWPKEDLAILGVRFTLRRRDHRS
jgi:SAM-dependent methyltransferase